MGDNTASKVELFQNDKNQRKAEGVVDMENMAVEFKASNSFLKEALRDIKTVTEAEFDEFMKFSNSDSKLSDVLAESSFGEMF